ncbi:MAG: GspH/FimT family pseudopilin, partial [Pseudomonadales bacterium]|nr:GspH/FimT family pseudopilin [Pseudomonadales bacterium]
IRLNYQQNLRDDCKNFSLRRWTQGGGIVNSTVRAFTLLELLAVLGIVAILFNLVSPGLAGWLQHRQADKVINDIARAISLARAAAIDDGTLVTFCRSRDGRTCSGSWEAGSIVFSDHNGDRLLNGRDRLLYRLEAIKFPGQLTFRSFQNRQYLQMTPLGFTRKQNGNFTWCPQNQDSRLAQQLIINQAGRTRIAQDRDGDGYREDSQGRALNCS